MEAGEAGLQAFAEKERAMSGVRSFLRPAAVAAGLLLAAGAAGAASGGNAPPVAGPSPAGPLRPPVPAFGCSRPGVPLCMDDGTTFVNADRMSGCQSEVKDYVDRTMAYLKCLNDENLAAGHDLTRNVDRFNCRLSGRKGCN